MATISKVQLPGNSTVYDLAVDWSNVLNAPSTISFGTCSTAASTQAKTVTVAPAITLEAGAMIRVIFTNAQTYNGSPTLNVNSLGAKNIRRVTGTNAARYEWQAGEVLDLIYDGTTWVIVQGGFATTTYYGLTKLYTGADSTSTALALTPASLKNIVENLIVSYPRYSSSSTYAVGSKVLYGNNTYVCNTAITTAEAWTAAHWTEIDSIQTQIDNLNSALEWSTW